MSLNPKLKIELKKEIIRKIITKLEQYDFSKKSGNPFIDIIFGKYSNIKSFIHGTATMLGSEYEIMARKIAETNPSFIEIKKFVLDGEISDDEKVIIKDIVKDLEESGSGSDYKKEIKKIYDAVIGNLRKTRITIDLYLKDKNGKEYFIEMKGPDPNKKEVRAAKEDLLNVVAIKKRNIPFRDFDEKVSIILGVYYNNHETEYNNWKVSPLFEKNKGLLLQENFWNFLGGSGTFEDIIKMIEEVRKEVYPLIDKKMKTL